MEIVLLPDELVNIIKSYIPIEYLSLTNKYYWNMWYNYSYSSKLQSSYWRFILRNDNNFVFEKYLIMQTLFFKRKKNYL